MSGFTTAKRIDPKVAYDAAHRLPTEHGRKCHMPPGFHTDCDVKDSAKRICPGGCDNRTPNLSVKWDEAAGAKQAPVIIKCWSGKPCRLPAILVGLGFPEGSIIGAGGTAASTESRPEATLRADAPKGVLAASFEHIDRHGRSFVHERYEDENGYKVSMPWRPKGKRPSERWYARGSDDVLAWVGEGEKVVDALAAAGCFALTFGGSSEFIPSMVAARTALGGVKEVVVVRDNDPSGIAWGLQMARRLDKAGYKVTMLDIAWEEGEDVVDLLYPGVQSCKPMHAGEAPDADGLTAFQSLLAPTWTEAASAELGMRRLSDIEPLPDKPLIEGVIADGPGIITCLLAAPKMMKSTIAAGLAARVSAKGEVVAVFDWEGHIDDEYVQRISALGGDLTKVVGGRPLGTIDQLVGMAEWLTSIDAKFAVIDSALAATAGLDAMSPEAAVAMMDEVQTWPCPVLLIAHTPKAGGSILGSQQWLAWTRLLWEVLPVDGNAAQRILDLRHGNKYAQGHQWLVDFEYPKTEQPAGQFSTMEVVYPTAMRIVTVPDDVAAKVQPSALGEAIIETLTDHGEALTINQLLDALKHRGIERSRPTVLGHLGVLAGNDQVVIHKPEGRGPHTYDVPK